MVFIRQATLVLALGALSCAASTADTNTEPRPTRTLTWVIPPSTVMPRQPAVEKSTIPCVSVRVTEGGDAKRVAGEPIPGIDVKLGRNPPSSLVVSTSNNDGVAEFCDLSFESGGAYFLTASADDASSLDSVPFLVPNRTVNLEWTVQPVSGIAGRTIAGEKGACPTVTATEVASAEPGADGAAARPGNPIGGIIVKEGKNPPGHGFYVQGITDSNGQVRFCDLTFDTAGVLALTATYEADAITDNPLYEPSGTAQSNPIFVGNLRRSVEWSVQPKAQLKVNEQWAESCPTVKVYANTGFAEGSELEEQRGDPLPRVSVLIEAVPSGRQLTLTTNERGEASLCGYSAGGAGAFNLRARVEYAEPALSDPFLVQ